MADDTKIEWTDATWNPIRGCSMARGSETGGCLNCYAARVAVRFNGPGMPYEGLARKTENGPRWTGKVRTLFERTVENSIVHAAGDPLLQPLRWQRPRRIFVNSMSDLFHETLPDADVDLIVAVMALAGQHTFQVLTKRPDRMADYLASRAKSIVPLETAARRLGRTFTISQDHDPMKGTLLPWPIPNVWWGVSAENQATLDARMPAMIRARKDMAVAWLSAEPLLGPMPTLWKWLPHSRDTSQTTEAFYPGLDWVVAGGESGPGARMMAPTWAREVRDQCQRTDQPTEHPAVPFLFKQWGEWAPGQHGMVRVGKKAAGRLLDGRTWDQYPAVAGGRG